MDDDGTQEENMAVVRMLMESVLGQGRMDLLKTLIADRHVAHMSMGDHFGTEGVRILLSDYRSALPDLVVTINDVFADGDRVARRFTLTGTVRERSPGSSPEHMTPAVLHGIAIDRLANGKIEESWVQIDSLSSITPDPGDAPHAVLVRADDT